MEHYGWDILTRIETLANISREKIASLGFPQEAKPEVYVSRKQNFSPDQPSVYTGFPGNKFIH